MRTALLLLSMSCSDSPQAADPPPRVPRILRKEAGDNQTARAGEAYAQSVVVWVGDAAGPLSEVRVRFFNSWLDHIDTTGADGLASYQWTAFQQKGTDTLKVQVQGLPEVRFHATVLPGPITGLGVGAAGGIEYGPMDRPFPRDIYVGAHDAYYNGRPGELITLVVPPGNGTLIGPDTVTTITESGWAPIHATWVLADRYGEDTLLIHHASGLTGMLVVFGGPGIFDRVNPDSMSGAVGYPLDSMLAFRVLHPDGDPLPGKQVFFSVDAGTLNVGQALTDSAGIARVSWTMPRDPGPVHMAASTRANPAPVFTTALAVLAQPGVMEPTSASSQSGFPGNIAPFTPAVRVLDARGRPLMSRQVTFTATEGSGSIVRSTVKLDSTGRAHSGAWVFGPEPGNQVVHASLEGVPDVGFQATVSDAPASEFAIDLRYIGYAADTIKTVVDSAVARWRRIILGDIPDIPVALPLSNCNPAIDEVVDDVVIYISFTAIDGKGGILGGAGPCAIRSSGSLPAIGRVIIDLADAGSLSRAELEAVILHELAHALGFGTIWGELGLYASPQGYLTFTGMNARGAYYLTASPASLFSRPPVPVEYGSGDGSDWSHWAEFALGDELMTPFIGAINPLSRITAASMRDLGYVVDDRLADPFQFGALLRAAPTRSFREARLEGEIAVLSPEGRIVRRVPRR